MRKLYRSNSNRMLGGVCAGIGDYLGVDATVVRIVTVVLALLPGPMWLAYVLGWLLIPLQPPYIEGSIVE
ncbi:MAG: PspC domain-containing protein [Actinomycetaceae bacterium]|nr:PspC domain-containing protein [Actinomycetaceae bacterium]